jgi:antirestriction protein ArdC
MRNPKARKDKPMRTDVYQKITDQIVGELEKGVRPWLKPWNAEHAAGRITRPLRGNGIPYRGINILMLWSAAMEKGFAAPIWMTFKQALEFNAHVRKGEQGSLVVYADKIIRAETDADTGEESERAIPFMKGYTVFNVEQIDGLPERFYAKAEPRGESVQRIERVEAFFAATGAVVRHGGNRAYYSIGTDHVQMPPIEAFRDAESYYATRAHETTHWTRHKSRLDRDFGRKRFGDEGYAIEELVAELGSAFLSADLDLMPEVRDDHAAYIASWIKVLKDDKRAIFSAASHAQRAADFLHGLQKPQDAAAAEAA